MAKIPMGYYPVYAGNKKWKLRKITIEMLQASTSIPFAIKRTLESIEPQDEWSTQLSRWAREVYREGCKLNLADEDLVRWIKTYARERNYTDKQIHKSLKYRHNFSKM